MKVLIVSRELFAQVPWINILSTSRASSIPYAATVYSICGHYYNSTCSHLYDRDVNSSTTSSSEGSTTLCYVIVRIVNLISAARDFIIVIPNNAGKGAHGRDRSDAGSP